MNDHIEEIKSSIKNNHHYSYCIDVTYLDDNEKTEILNNLVEHGIRIKKSNFKEYMSGNFYWLCWNSVSERVTFLFSENYITLSDEEVIMVDAKKLYTNKFEIFINDAFEDIERVL